VKWAGIDVLVSNAGIQIVHKLEEFPFADWKKASGDSLDGAFLTSKAVPAAYVCCEVGGDHLHGSAAFARSLALKSAYVTAKHGLLGLARVIQRGWDAGGAANVICPVSSTTPLVEKQIPNRRRRLHLGKGCGGKSHAWRTVDHDSPIEDVAEVAHLFAPSQATL